MKKEHWKSIPGHSGYYASNLGRIKSTDRYVKGPYGSKSFRSGKILKETLHSGGVYYIVNLNKIPRYVHVLIMAAFVGPKPDKMDVAHLDGDASNNNLSNLKYMSRSDNNRQISTHGHRKLTEEQVREIKRMAPDMVRGDQLRLQKKLGLCSSMISHILRGKLYSHVK